MIKVFVERSSLSEYIQSPRFAVDVVIAPVRIDHGVVSRFEESDLQIQEIAGFQYHEILIQRFKDGDFYVRKPLHIRARGGWFDVIFVPFVWGMKPSIILYDGLYDASLECLEKVVVPITSNWLLGDARSSVKIIQEGIEEASGLIDQDMEVCLLCCSEGSRMVRLAGRLESHWGTK